MFKGDSCRWGDEWTRQACADGERGPPLALAQIKSQSWSSNGNHVMSILQVLLKIPGGTYRQDPPFETTKLVW